MRSIRRRWDEGDGQRSANKINSPFGPRVTMNELHLGIDINRETDGDAIISVCAGTVVSRTTDLYNEKGELRTQGYSISIESTDPKLEDPETGKQLIFTYSHMKSAPTFRVGVDVSKGTKLGSVGNTGRSDGPHLHFECSNSGGAWSPGDEKYTRITRRVNPTFFYSMGSFRNSKDCNQCYTRIWNESRSNYKFFAPNGNLLAKCQNSKHKY